MAPGRIKDLADSLFFSFLYDWFGFVTFVGFAVPVCCLCRVSFSLKERVWALGVDSSFCSVAFTCVTGAALASTVILLLLLV